MAWRSPNGRTLAGWRYAQNVADLLVLSGLQRVASAHVLRQETQQLDDGQETQQLDDGLEAKHESTSTAERVAAKGHWWTPKPVRSQSNGRPNGYIIKFPNKNGLQPLG
jgi:hypothetical protein